MENQLFQGIMILKMLVWNSGENGKWFSLLYQSFFWYRTAEATVSADFLHGGSAVHEWYKMQKVFLFCTTLIRQQKPDRCFPFWCRKWYRSSGGNGKLLSLLYQSNMANNGNSSGLKWWLKCKKTFCFVPLLSAMQNKKAKEKSCCKCQHNSLTFWIVYCKNGKRLSVLYRLQVVLWKHK